MLAEKICKLCFAIDSPEWWKCCEEHCTEDEVDVVCLNCKNELHPICLAMGVIGFGIQPLCGWVKGHEGRHTWEPEIIDVETEQPLVKSSRLEALIVPYEPLGDVAKEPIEVVEIPLVDLIDDTKVEGP